MRVADGALRDHRVNGSRSFAIRIESVPGALSTTSSPTASAPTFSAIVANFNDTSLIGKALATLANQTEPLHEIIVVDDGSTDGSGGTLAAIVNATPRARLICLPANRGVVAALNTGLSEATGEFILLCSANDHYDVHLVEHCRRLLARHPTLGVITGRHNVWNEARQEAGAGLTPVSELPAAFSAADLVRACRRSPAIVAPGFVMRRDKVVALGGLDPALRWHSDWFLFAVIAFTSGYGFVPETFSTITIGAGTRYSDGMLDWTQERPVLRSLIQRLNELPAAAEGFRRGALLPCYDLRAIWLLRDPDLPWMLTPLLVWRMLVHSVSYRLKDRVPRSVVLRFRGWVRS
jgi:glycosyltransferase involved in cell wall biosynthesis